MAPTALGGMGTVGMEVGRQPHIEVHHQGVVDWWSAGEIRRRRQAEMELEEESDFVMWEMLRITFRWLARVPAWVMVPLAEMRNGRKGPGFWGMVHTLALPFHGPRDRWLFLHLGSGWGAAPQVLRLPENLPQNTSYCRVVSRLPWKQRRLQDLLGPTHSAPWARKGCWGFLSNYRMFPFPAGGGGSGAPCLHLFILLPKCVIIFNEVNFLTLTMFLDEHYPKKLDKMDIPSIS